MRHTSRTLSHPLKKLLVEQLIHNDSVDDYDDDYDFFSFPFYFFKNIVHLRSYIKHDNTISF